MKHFYLPYLQASVLSLLFIFSVPAFAVDKNLELVTQRGCLTCHQMKHDPAKKIKLAPSYEEIAARYKDDKKAVEYLTNRILNGTVKGKQNWKGEVNMRFMPPNINVSRIDANQMTNWILNIKESQISPEVIKHERMLSLAITSGCTTCHAINKNPDHRYVPLAPAYREIAERFASQKGARSTLIDSVIHGTFNKEKNWKNVNMRFMPPSPALSQENAEKLVDWILTLK